MSLRFGYNNYFDNYQAVASSAAAGYPAENAQDNRLSRVWRTTGDSGISVYIASTGILPTAACIAGHNLSTGATVSVQSATEATFASPSFSTTIPRISGTMSRVFASTAGAKSHWRIIINDSGNSCGYIEIGRIYIGTNIAIANKYAPDFTDERVDSSIAARSISGQVYADAGYLRRKMSLSFPWVTNAEKTQMIALQDAAHLSPVFMIHDSASSTQGALYGTISGVVYRHLHADNYGMTMTIEEAR